MVRLQRGGFIPGMFHYEHGDAPRVAGVTNPVCAVGYLDSLRILDSDQVLVDPYGNLQLPLCNSPLGILDKSKEFQRGALFSFAVLRSLAEASL